MTRHIVLFHTYANFKESTQKYHFQLKGWCYEESTSYKTKIKSTLSRRLLSPFSGGSNDSIEKFEQRTSGFLANPIQTRIRLSILGKVLENRFDSIKEQNDFYQKLLDKGGLKNTTTIQTTTLLDGSFCVDFVLGKEQLPEFIESEDFPLQKLLLLYATFNDEIPTPLVTSPLNSSITTPTDAIPLVASPIADISAIEVNGPTATDIVSEMPDPVFIPDTNVDIGIASIHIDKNEPVNGNTQLIADQDSEVIQKDIVPFAVIATITDITTEIDEVVFSTTINNPASDVYGNFGFIPLISTTGISLISDVDDTIKLSVNYLLPRMSLKESGALPKLHYSMK
jgi:hypothetical protein